MSKGSALDLAQRYLKNESEFCAAFKASLAEAGRCDKIWFYGGSTKRYTDQIGEMRRAVHRG